jgi:hypothetical protein
MARALFGTLVTAMLGLTGYAAYSWYNADVSAPDTSVSVKKGCCALEAKPTTCCSESAKPDDCTGECPSKATKDDGKCCSGDDTGGCCSGKKAGSCCGDKKDEPAADKKETSEKKD